MVGWGVSHRFWRFSFGSTFFFLTPNLKLCGQRVMCFLSVGLGGKRWLSRWWSGSFGGICCFHVVHVLVLLIDAEFDLAFEYGILLFSRKRRECEDQSRNGDVVDVVREMTCGETGTYRDEAEVACRHAEELSEDIPVCGTKDVRGNIGADLGVGAEIKSNNVDHALSSFGRGVGVMVGFCLPGFCDA